MAGAYGLGIADDKHGIAIILHALTMVKTLGVDGYGVWDRLLLPNDRESVGQF